eukprot:CAMPEP_0198334512 /NCGR_PEP_ID=MMETSP1450-20131203/19663_1 /TAXON_ID=753684 ORGANISM="Madagascaria erythrocladiodes, Strain CCMP3234" /NCGR_SAMPLE_ID=MMETSP1450 /ASSEMBLY_ACC=CAM_ASM_001115 /LENGTH=86 /DNA_ID=CAMNT_0044039105 /DNA_START=126 /DNA_END=383 /DNA_ORIENTATION=+
MIGDDIAGFLMVQGDEIEQLFVSKDHRGCGIGKALLAEAERKLTIAGHSQVWLAVVPRNFEARCFYEKCGWLDEGEFEYHAEVEDG